MAGGPFKYPSPPLSSAIHGYAVKTVYGRPWNDLGDREWDKTGNLIDIFQIGDQFGLRVNETQSCLGAEADDKRA
ncbi:hypothetical protein N7451_012506 [Penicillium sp. IBT 35674x]|nr:hypothetical protein N7451_012506 [Penicillium sp. IBT 35674x]